MLGFFGFLLALALLLLFLFQLLLLLCMLLLLLLCLLLLCLLLLLLLHPLFLRLICVSCRSLGALLFVLLLQSLALLFLLCAQLLLLLLLLSVQIGARGMRRCCLGGWRLIVGLNGCSCGSIVTRRGRRIVRGLSAFCRALSRFWLRVPPRWLIRLRFRLTCRRRPVRGT